MFSSEVLQHDPVELRDLASLRQRHPETGGKKQNADGGHVGIGSGCVALITDAAFATNLQYNNVVSVDGVL